MFASMEKITDFHSGLPKRPLWHFLYQENREIPLLSDESIGLAKHGEQQLGKTGIRFQKNFFSKTQLILELRKAGPHGQGH